MPSYQLFAICLIAGAASGFLGGMLGVGGGVIIAPTLLMMFEWMGLFNDPSLPNNALILFAVGTSMSSIIFTTGASAVIQTIRDNVDWQLVGIWVPFLTIGAFSSSFVAERVSIGGLKILIAIVLLIVSIVMLLKVFPTAKTEKRSRIIPGTISSSAGLLSGMAGLGGGNILVPAMLYFNTPPRKAAAVASVGGLCVAVFGAAGYVVTGLSLDYPWSFGYVYLPSLIPIAIMNILFAPLGVAVGQRISSDLFKRIFGCIMMAVSIRMFVSVF